MAAAEEVTVGGDAVTGSLCDVVSNATPSNTITFAPNVDMVTISDTSAAITVGKTNLTITGNIGPDGKPATTITMSGSPRATPIFLNTDDAGRSLNLKNLAFSGIQVSQDNPRGRGIVSASSTGGNTATLGSQENVSFTGNEVTIENISFRSNAVPGSPERGGWG